MAVSCRRELIKTIITSEYKGCGVSSTKDTGNQGNSVELSDAYRRGFWPGRVTEWTKNIEYCGHA
jgi:hypothetical protein